MNSFVVLVLVGTRSPGNLGAVCRVAKAFGFPDVRLVRPELTFDAEEARRLAHGAEDVLDATRTFESIADAVLDCHRSVATTARSRDWMRPVLVPRDLRELLLEVDEERPLALVFGPEDRGLSNDDLAACDEIVSIPLPPDPSATLSLPAAATILLHEAHTALAEPSGPPARSETSERGSRPIGTAELDALVDEIGETLDQIGFRPRPNAVRFRGNLRDFLARARPTRGDRLTLRHVFAQIGKWRRRVIAEARRAATGRSEVG